MNDLMIDLETLGTTNTAVVVSIGAVFFDPLSGRIGDQFYKVCDLQSQLDVGRTIEQHTLKWWLGQSENAKNVLIQESIMTEDVVDMFVNFTAANSEKPFVWGNGSLFDIGILSSLLRDFGYQLPWKYSDVMDFRTFKRFNGQNLNVTRIGVHHNALDDALSQAKYVIQVLGNKNEDSK